MKWNSASCSGMKAEYPVTQEEAQVLKELEQILGKSIPLVNQIEWDTCGVKVEGGHLIGLGLYACGLRTLPESFGQIKSLQTLNLNHNELTTLPEPFGDLKSLQTVDLRYNKLRTLPESFGQLISLQTLNLALNQLRALPESFGQLKSLQTLNLSWNNLTTLPESFGDLKSLQELGLGSNKLRTLPEPILQLKNLQTLNLSTDRLRTLPESFGDLKSLQVLALGGNQLTTLPESFGHLESLQKLEIYGTKLTTLPESFSELKSLQTLDLNHNKLTTLPESFGELKSLQRLALGGNQLTTFPESFGHLESLQELEIYGNKLTTLPESFRGLKRLISLKLYKNKWEAEWQGIEGLGISAIRELCWKKAPIKVFITYASEEGDRYSIKGIKKKLKIYKGIREVYMSGEDKLSECQLMVFLGTKSSATSQTCRHELGVAVSNEIEIIPIKGADITEWNELNRIDLSQQGFGFLDLGMKKGLTFDGTKANKFCEELYEYIRQYKEAVNLFDPEARKVGKQKETMKNIIGTFLESEDFRGRLKENLMRFKKVRSELGAKEISIKEYIDRCDQLLHKK